MKRQRLLAWRFAATTMLVTASLSIAAHAEDPPAKTKEKPADIYDRTADGEKQIAAALAVAKRDNKRVLLQFGANWCGWCHKLHKLFQADKEIATDLRSEYVVVLIDVDTVDDKPHNAMVNERYGNPKQHGLPAIVILDSEGQQLTTQDTAKLEEGDHHNPAKVLDFLRQWHAPAISAEETLAAAQAKAKRESKLVFVHFGAPWCGWCHRLEEYLYRDEIASVMNAAFVCVKIDVDRMTQGKEVGIKHRPNREDEGGVPFFVIADAEGKRLADSYAATGNVGFPAAPEEIAHFLNVLRKTAPALTAEQLGALERGLTKKRE